MDLISLLAHQLRPTRFNFHYVRPTPLLHPLSLFSSSSFLLSDFPLLTHRFPTPAKLVFLITATYYIIIPPPRVL